MKKYVYIGVAAIMFLSSACRKHLVTPGGSAVDLLKDSVYLYAQEEYYWYDALPAYNIFNPRGFTGADDPTALSSEVDALSQYKINPVTSKPYEYSPTNIGHAKYSFIDGGQVATLLSGSQGDYGLSILYNTTTDLRIKYVYPASPAALAGIKRGYQIISIKGVSSLVYDGKTTSTNVNAIVNAVYYSSTLTMTLQRPNGSTFTANLSTGSYTTNPVIKDTVIATATGQTVGYMEFNQFTTLSNAQTYIDNAFKYFAANAITDLVVDLRYNGGGAVETAEYLDNLIVPSSKNGTPMYTAYYNAKLQNDQYPLLSKVYLINPGEFKPANNTSVFAKNGSLNLSRVFFIVTSNTASASELTINNLRPHMNVQLIGSTSYGKPVGFFPIPIGQYQLYVPEFETKNASNQGGYYTGMTPGTTDYPGYADNDDITKDFGDPTEVLFAHALSYIRKGTYSLSTPRIQSITSGSSGLSGGEVETMNRQFNNSLFNGMISGKQLTRKH